jgi:tetratricopeptide (TPR) repeat protein
MYPSDARSPTTILEQADVHARAAQWAPAAALYLSVADRVREHRDHTSLATAVYGAARMRWFQGRHEEAEELTQLCWHVAEVRGLDTMLARAVNMLATVHHTRNDLAHARELYETALKIARDVGNDELIGFVSQNLGVLANIRGDLHEARALYLEGIASTIRSGNRATAAMAYNNLGMVCTDLQEWLEATLHFDQGLELAERFGHKQMIARLHANRVEPLIHLGQTAQAREGLDRAERMARDTEDHETKAIVHRLRAVLARLEGNLEFADRELARDLALAVEWGLELEHAEALGGLATLRRAQGREEEAVRTLQEARERFAALGAARDTQRLEQVLAEWEEQGVGTG